MRCAKHKIGVTCGHPKLLLVMWESPAVVAMFPPFFLVLWL